MIKKALIKAEAMFRRGNGEDKFIFVCNYIRKKLFYLVPLCIVKFAVRHQFRKHSDFVNRLIVRDWIKI